MHTYGGKPFLMYNTALQLQETICAACLKADDNQHHQLIVYFLESFDRNPQLQYTAVYCSLGSTTAYGRQAPCCARNKNKTTQCGS